ncbi:hypothetical protein [Usitatibacter palustris]|uniref:hypothetical protein n=1 Tax=Usitatibacter palustris TaxID=2732487 RepID=UPI003CCD2693
MGRYVESDPIGLAGGPNTFGYAGANSLKHSDPEGLDYWIENAARTEQQCPQQGCGAHQSVCVGKPHGKRFCISFGRLGDQGYCFANCVGTVYQDRSPPGPIEPGSYRQSSGATDKAIEENLRPGLGGTGRYDFFGYPADNCRTWSQGVFNGIDRRFRGTPSRPPTPTGNR